jgi:hypothetical protein
MENTRKIVAFPHATWFGIGRWLSSKWPWRLLAAIAVGVSIAWRLTQYLSAPSLTTDEVALARNILDRSPIELLQRLSYGQVAPFGFLLAIKACSTAFGSAEWSLRLVPFVCGLAALPLFWHVARRLMDEPAAGVATGLFALAAPVALWSTILKPYSSDVLCTLVVISVAQWLPAGKLERRHVLTAIVVGGSAALFSHVAVFALAATGAVLTAEAVHRRSEAIAARLIIVAGWIAVLLPNALWSRHNMRPVDFNYMRRFWSPLFVPAQFVPALRWLSETLLMMFSDWPWPNASLMYRAPTLWLLLFVCGAAALVWTRPRTGLLLIGPVLLTAAASAMDEYPFGGRAGLFLLPLLLLLVVAGARALGGFISPAARMLAPALLLPIAADALARFPPAFTPEHLRPDLQYISAQRRPGDAVWVYYGSANAFAYYDARIPMPRDVVFGQCDRTDPRANLYQLDQVRGRHRVWIVLTHVITEEREFMLQYLDTIGVRKDEHTSTPQFHSVAASAVYLYQLDDPVRLAAASATRIPVAPIDDPSPWTCFGTMSTAPDGDPAAIAALEHEQY